MTVSPTEKAERLASEAPALRTPEHDQVDQPLSVPIADWAVTALASVTSVPWELIFVEAPVAIAAPRLVLVLRIN